MRPGPGGRGLQRERRVTARISGVKKFGAVHCAPNPPYALTVTSGGLGTHCVAYHEQFLDRERWALFMKHTVAVCANRPQVFDWVNQVFFGHVGNRLQVVNFYVILTKGPVGFFEIKTANATCVTVMLNTCLACMRISIISL